MASTTRASSTWRATSVAAGNNSAVHRVHGRRHDERLAARRRRPPPRSSSDRLRVPAWPVDAATAARVAQRYRYRDGEGRSVSSRPSRSRSAASARGRGSPRRESSTPACPRPAAPTCARCSEPARPTTACACAGRLAQRADRHSEIRSARTSELPRIRCPTSADAVAIGASPMPPGSFGQPPPTWRKGGATPADLTTTYPRAAPTPARSSCPRCSGGVAGDEELVRVRLHGGGARRRDGRIHDHGRPGTDAYLDLVRAHRYEETVGAATALADA